MNKFIVTTTINEMTDALRAYDALDGWHLIVIGDRKTPDLKLEHGEFVPASVQHSLGFECVKHIPWDRIQRRNIGFLLALQQGADLIATIDDDNIPYNNWSVINSKMGLTGPGHFVEIEAKNDLNVSDILDAYTHSPATTWHRGYPVQHLISREQQKYTVLADTTPIIIDVKAGLWDDDPDVDAISRLANEGQLNMNFHSEYEMFASYVIASRQFSPFNTQNTTFTRRIAPAMCLAYDIGRMDDIWASYYAQRIMHELGSRVMFCDATVRQVRNQHDFVRDLENEMIGYKHTHQLLRWLNDVQLDAQYGVLGMYEQLVRSSANLQFISDDMRNFQAAWIDDVARII